MTSPSRPVEVRAARAPRARSAPSSRSSLRVRLEVALQREDADQRRHASTSPGWRGAAAPRACASRARPSPCRGPRTRAATRSGSLEVGRRLDDRARRACAGSSDLKMPEPTKTPSAPSCIISAASAGVAMPPAQNSTTGQLAGLRRRSRTRSSGACSSLAAVASSASSSVASALDLAGDRAHVAHGLDDVAGAGLALGADHRRALADAPQRLAEVGRAAHERDLERPLVDVVGLVGRASGPRTRRRSRPRAPRAPAPRRSGRCAPSP